MHNVKITGARGDGPRAEGESRSQRPEHVPHEGGARHATHCQQVPRRQIRILGTSFYSRTGIYF